MTTIKLNRDTITLLLALLLTILLFSCNKTATPDPQKPSYSSEVFDKWITVQLRLMRNATGIPNHGFSRPFAYAGIAALESMQPGIHGQGRWLNNWNGLTGLPQPDHSKEYYLPANVNGALATINRS